MQNFCIFSALLCVLAFATAEAVNELSGSAFCIAEPEKTRNAQIQLVINRFLDIGGRTALPTQPDGDGKFALDAPLDELESRGGRIEIKHRCAIDDGEPTRTLSIDVPASFKQKGLPTVLLDIKRPNRDRLAQFFDAHASLRNRNDTQRGWESAPAPFWRPWTILKNLGWTN